MATPSTCSLCFLYRSLYNNVEGQSVQRGANLRRAERERTQGGDSDLKSNFSCLSRLNRSSRSKPMAFTRDCKDERSLFHATLFLTSYAEGSR